MTAKTLSVLPDLTDQIKSALQQWHEPYRTDSPLMDLLVFRNAQAKGSTVTASERLCINQVLLDGMESFDSANSELAKILKARFADDLSVQATANRFNVVPGTIQKKQRLGWEELARVIDAKEQTLRREVHARLLERLELPTYSQLWGVDEHLQTLTNLITDPDGPSIIAIEGIGGIGKTSLTNALMRHLIETDVIGHGDYVGCAWVTARRNTLNAGGILGETERPALTSNALVHALVSQIFDEEQHPTGLNTQQMSSMLKNRLADAPHVIVVDNLETVLDIEELLEEVHKLINPSRIVLTTRHNLFAESDIFHFSVPSLDKQHSLNLVRTEARQRNLQHLVDAMDEELHPIFDTVGGNPLALRLVVGQTHIHSLRDVLADLKAARGKPIENLYTHIYWNAWKNLDEASREIWLVMPIANGQGMDLLHLVEVADSDADVLRNALDTLVTINLVERRGDLNESRYTIHPLTRTFLQNQVLVWDEMVAE